MAKISRIRFQRIAIITAIIAGLLVMTITRPSWLRDVWLKATTRAIPFQFSSLGACEERDAYQPDQISLGPNRKTIEGYVSLNCADKPGDPSASQRGGTIFLHIRSLAIQPMSGLSAACNCSNKIRFSLNSQIKTGQQVTLIMDNFESAQLIAP